LLWGLGYADVGEHSLHRAWWQMPVTIKVDAQHRQMSVIYKVGDLSLEVSRKLNADSLVERYHFKNIGKQAVPMTDETGLATVLKEVRSINALVTYLPTESRKSRCS
jgi:hypothetical protein